MVSKQSVTLIPTELETGKLILMDIDMWRVVEAQDRRVLREQHLVTCQDSQTVDSRELD
jgi:hypothetical protein